MIQTHEFDHVIIELADYVADKNIRHSAEAEKIALEALLDSLGCSLLALNYQACQKILGPVVPGETLSLGVKIPGTNFILEPIRAAFNIGSMIRWLDYNDTWLAAEWGHPSDNLGAILAVAYYLSIKEPQSLITVKQVLLAMIKAYEIQGVLALENSFNKVGLDHVLLVRLASAAVACEMLGANRDQILNCISNAWIDGSALRTYRHSPNTGSRKSWAAGDATSRGVFLSFLAISGEMGYPSALSAKNWGFQDVAFRGQPIKLNQKLESYVMENILFKISFPAEFHAQTAVECAIKLSPQVLPNLDKIEKIIIETQESAIRIIDKTGPLYNPADRDHCIQYMVAIGLLKGNLVADDYEDKVASLPEIDFLRSKMQVVENNQMSKDYLDPQKRAIGNAIQVFFKNRTSTDKIIINYPVGHKFRRNEGIPLLRKKFANNISTVLPKKKCESILALCDNSNKLKQLDIKQFIDFFWLG